MDFDTTHWSGVFVFGLLIGVPTQNDKRDTVEPRLLKRPFAWSLGML